MERIAWRDDYGVGIEVIDEQHKTFINLLNQAYELFHQSPDLYRISELVSKIIIHAGEHFVTEEKYFDEFKYEFADEHRAEHRKLLDQADEFRERLRVEGVPVVVDLVTFLEDWLAKHTLIHDRKYVECFRKHGL